MDALTRAELLGYPGNDLVDKAMAHHSESARRPAPPAPAPVRRRVDLRPFPGRDRVERAEHYLRAHFPRAASWSAEAVRELALGLLRDSDVVD